MEGTIEKAFGSRGGHAAQDGCACHVSSHTRFHLLKDARLSTPTIMRPQQDEGEGMSGIRCPRCRWRPDVSSRWSCNATEAPEPFFHGCGTVWNTFATKGRCPGCAHQWHWTSCLRCAEWSPHVDWYEHVGTPQ